MKIPAKFEKWFVSHGATYREIGTIMAVKDTPHYNALMAIAYRCYKRGLKSKQEEIYSAIRRGDTERVVHRAVLGK